MITPKELSRRIINFYQSSRKVYGNHSPIYKNDAPICHNLESALRYIFEVSPEVYKDISNFGNDVFDAVKLKVLQSALDTILNNCLEEYKEPIMFIKDLLNSLLDGN